MSHDNHLTALFDAMQLAIATAPPVAIDTGTYLPVSSLEAAYAAGHGSYKATAVITALTTPLVRHVCGKPRGSGTKPCLATVPCEGGSCHRGHTAHTQCNRWAFSSTANVRDAEASATAAAAAGSSPAAAAATATATAKAGRLRRAQFGECLGGLFAAFGIDAATVADMTAEEQQQVVDQLCPVTVTICFKLSGKRSTLAVNQVFLVALKFCTFAYRTLDSAAR